MLIQTRQYREGSWDVTVFRAHGADNGVAAAAAQKALADAEPNVGDWNGDQKHYRHVDSGVSVWKEFSDGQWVTFNPTLEQLQARARKS